MSTIAQLREQQQENVRQRLFTILAAYDNLVMQLEFAKLARPTAGQLRGDNLVDSDVLNFLEVDDFHLYSLTVKRDELIKVLNDKFGYNITVNSLRTHFE